MSNSGEDHSCSGSIAESYMIETDDDISANDSFLENNYKRLPLPDKNKSFFVDRKSIWKAIRARNIDKFRSEFVAESLKNSDENFQDNIILDDEEDSEPGSEYELKDEKAIFKKLSEVVLNPESDDDFEAQTCRSQSSFGYDRISFSDDFKSFSYDSDDEGESFESEEFNWITESFVEESEELPDEENDENSDDDDKDDHDGNKDPLKVDPSCIFGGIYYPKEIDYETKTSIKDYLFQENDDDEDLNSDSDHNNDEDAENDDGDEGKESGDYPNETIEFEIVDKYKNSDKRCNFFENLAPIESKAKLADSGKTSSIFNSLKNMFKSA